MWRGYLSSTIWRYYWVAQFRSLSCNYWVIFTVSKKLLVVSLRQFLVYNETTQRMPAHKWNLTIWSNNFNNVYDECFSTLQHRENWRYILLQIILYVYLYPRVKVKNYPNLGVIIWQLGVIIENYSHTVDKNKKLLEMTEYKYYLRGVIFVAGKYYPESWVNITLRFFCVMSNCNIYLMYCYKSYFDQNTFRSLVLILWKLPIAQ